MFLSFFLVYILGSATAAASLVCSFLYNWLFILAFIPVVAGTATLMDYLVNKY